MSAWEELSTAEEDDVWKRFNAQFRFRPSVHAQDWPGIVEPHPFITWSIPHPWSAADTADLHQRALGAFRTALLAGERLYALDWQHACFWLQPHQPLDTWRIPVLPNGEYYIFLAPNLEWGWFGHPWEQTICVFGERLLAAVLADPPALLKRTLRAV